MRQPRDKKRPNTRGSAETRQRQRNFKYVAVSKKIGAVEIPLVGPDGNITIVKEWQVEKKGQTYKNENKKKNKHERQKDRIGNPQGS